MKKPRIVMPIRIDADVKLKLEKETKKRFSDKSELTRELYELYFYKYDELFEIATMRKITIISLMKIIHEDFLSRIKK